MNQQIARNEHLIKRLSVMTYEELTETVKRWRYERENYIPPKKAKKPPKPKKPATETAAVKNLLEKLSPEEKAKLLAQLEE